MNKKKNYLVSLKTEDGCELLVHGKNYKEGWSENFPGGISAICPHGKSIEIGTGTKADVLRTRT